MTETKSKDAPRLLQWKGDIHGVHSKEGQSRYIVFKLPNLLRWAATITHDEECPQGVGEYVYDTLEEAMRACQFHYWRSIQN